MVEPAFRILLATDPAIAAIVGDRIFHNVRPRDERRPCLVLTRASSYLVRRFGGASAATKGRMQVDAFAESYQLMKDLAGKVCKRVDAYSGTVGGVRFHFIEIADIRDMPAAPLDGRALPLFASSVDAQFLFQN